MNIQIERSHLLTYGLPALIILSSVFLALSPLLARNADLAMGITYDLTLTAPLVYFFLIRKKRIPQITVVPLFVLGILLAGFVLPGHQEYHLNLVITILLPIVEFAFLSVILYRVYKTIKAFKNTTNATGDFYIIIKESAKKALGYSQIANIFASEIAMVYYALFAWKRKQKPVHGFTSFHENGIIALLTVIVFMIIVETFVIHLLVARRSDTVAWVLTVSSLYAAIQIIGHLKALRHRYSEIGYNYLFLKYGLFGDMQIALHEIRRVDLVSDNIEEEGLKVEKLALLKDIESHNVAIYFTEKQKVEKAYGFTKEFDTILLLIDNKKEFVETINTALQKGA